ncbi:translation initiation factor IF-2-like [Aquila chrysaetos chrysaetos]|uniref:translation initiation factor IF-2-like n=1 Tax=Aquila chrysaetos chrysaetos TaxID=223781 RepID=UPI001176F096|nr:translation initiation factor IF-2-like [Aquila chrysaetos chrysaetos]
MENAPSGLMGFRKKTTAHYGFLLERCRGCSSSQNGALRHLFPAARTSVATQAADRPQRDPAWEKPGGGGAAPAPPADGARSPPGGRGPALQPPAAPPSAGRGPGGRTPSAPSVGPGLSPPAPQGRVDTLQAPPYGMRGVFAAAAL